MSSPVQRPRRILSKVLFTVHPRVDRAPACAVGFPLQVLAFQGYTHSHKILSCDDLFIARRVPATQIWNRFREASHWSLVAVPASGDQAGLSESQRLRCRGPALPGRYVDLPVAIDWRCGCAYSS